VKKQIFISGDHAGFELKQKIKSWLAGKGFEIKDFGPLTYDKNDDYPDFVIPMAKAMIKNKNKDSRGIIIAGSGEGESIAVNKFRGIRAAIYHGKNLNIVKTTREHNDSNVLSLGSRFVKFEEMKKAIDLFLKTKFAGGRHKRRLEKIEKMVVRR